MANKKITNDLFFKPGSTIANKTGDWRVYYPTVDHEICIGCGTCDRVCPEGICFKTGQKNSKGLFFYDRDLNFCKGCGICAKECPVKAISMHLEEK
ncbi:4Fe-4S dicluster domain-containing protein [Patescibacteria group bacterium]|nr:4Fe-4S dicluster domain-containing protein [Patescibacteria group bacterium]